MIAVEEDAWSLYRDVDYVELWMLLLVGNDEITYSLSCYYIRISAEGEVVNNKQSDFLTLLAIEVYPSISVFADYPQLAIGRTAIGTHC